MTTSRARQFLCRLALAAGAAATFVPGAATAGGSRAVAPDAFDRAVAVKLATTPDAFERAVLVRSANVPDAFERAVAIHLASPTPLASVVDSGADGFDWSDAMIGGGFGVGITLSALGAAVASRRTRLVAHY